MFAPEAIVATLGRHRVRYVMVGGLAAVSLGSPLVTNDMDICYDRRRDNLERLASALRELRATLRGAPPGLPFQLDAETLHRGDAFTFDTDAGPFDILGTPSGTGGFDDLQRGAVKTVLWGHAVAVAGIDDLIAMKRAAGRRKDLGALPHLEALADELQHLPEP